MLIATEDEKETRWVNAAKKISGRDTRSVHIEEKKIERVQRRVGKGRISENVQEGMRSSTSIRLVLAQKTKFTMSGVRGKKE